MDASATSTIEPLLDGLAERIARRDLPPADTTANPAAPEQMMRRLMTALKTLVPHRNYRGHLAEARMLYHFMEHETRTAAELAHAAGLERVAGSHAHTGLVRAGLLQWSQQGPRRLYRLSRWGEDWLLAIGRCEAVPERPA